MRRDDIRVQESVAERARPIDRRTVAKGVAWSVPAILVATAAPAAAASATPPSVAFTSTSGTVDPATGAVALTLGLTSTADGQLRVMQLDGAVVPGLPAVRAIATGANTLTLTATDARLTSARTVTLTYSVDNGASLRTVAVDLVSVTRCTGGSALAGSWFGANFALVTLAFTGSSSSRVQVLGISSADGAQWEHPTGKLGLVSGRSGLSLTFLARRSVATSTTATVRLRVDGGPAQEVEVTLTALRSTAARARAFGG
jgi:hypothetical protein